MKMVAADDGIADKSACRNINNQKLGFLVAAVLDAQGKVASVWRRFDEGVGRVVIPCVDVEEQLELCVLIFLNEKNRGMLVDVLVYR